MVSVIICTYNQEKFIAQTIDSILMQKCDEPFEILVGEDCSTDNTGRIVDDYQKRYPGIVRVIRPRNNVGEALNTKALVENVRGEILSVCDGDDFWIREDVLQLQLDVFRFMPDVGMVCAKAKCYIQEKGDYEGTLGYAGAENLMTMLRDSRDVAAPTIAFRTSLMRQCVADSEWFISNNMFYDSVMAYWFALKSRVKYIDEELAAYRVLANSACHSQSSDRTYTYMRRYFMVKWHFILTHPEIYGEEVFQILMKDYDNGAELKAYTDVLKIRASKTYKLGNMFLSPLRKMKNKLV